MHIDILGRHKSLPAQPLLAIVGLDVLQSLQVLTLAKRHVCVDKAVSSRAAPSLNKLVLYAERSLHFNGWFCCVLRLIEFGSKNRLHQVQALRMLGASMQRSDLVMKKYGWAWLLGGLPSFTAQASYYRALEGYSNGELLEILFVSALVCAGIVYTFFFRK